MLISEVLEENLIRSDVIGDLAGGKPGGVESIDTIIADAK
jgi:hypothetical protein